VSRARRSITLASFLFWYLLTELGDDGLGARAAAVQVRRSAAAQAACSDPCADAPPPPPPPPPSNLAVSLPSSAPRASRPVPPRSAFTSRLCSWPASSTSRRRCR
jgi:hypothetical protein